MSKSKSSATAIIMVAMLVIILVCLFLLKAWIICGILLGLLAALGMVCATSWLIEWLSDPGDRKNDKNDKNDEPIDVPPVVAAEPMSADFEETYDAIREEVADIE